MSPSQQLERIVCKKEFSEKLIAAGIVPWATLWWWRLDDDWEVGTDVQIIEDNGSGNYDPGLSIPAWTKEELDVMIGGEFNLPQLPEKKTLSIKQDPTWHIWGDLESRIDYPKGADCSAAVLLRLIEKGRLRPAEANKRFLDVFKLVENGEVIIAKFPRFPL